MFDFMMAPDEKPRDHSDYKSSCGGQECLWQMFDLPVALDEKSGDHYIY